MFHFSQHILPFWRKSSIFMNHFDYRRLNQSQQHAKCSVTNRLKHITLETSGKPLNQSNFTVECNWMFVFLWSISFKLCICVRCFRLKVNRCVIHASILFHRIVWISNQCDFIDANHFVLMTTCIKSKSDHFIWFPKTNTWISPLLPDSLLLLHSVTTPMKCE